MPHVLHAQSRTQGEDSHTFPSFVWSAYQRIPGALLASNIRRLLAHVKYMRATQSAGRMVGVGSGAGSEAGCRRPASMDGLAAVRQIPPRTADPSQCGYVFRTKKEPGNGFCRDASGPGTSGYLQSVARLQIESTFSPRDRPETPERTTSRTLDSDMARRNASSLSDVPASWIV